MAGIFPVDVGPQYEGEVIRKDDMYVELGGPKQKSKFELVTLKSLDEVENEKITVIGPDLGDLEEGSSYPVGMMIDVAGEKLEKDMEPVFERRIHLYTNYIEGFYHMNQRDDIWMRINKDSFNKGLNSFEMIGQILMFLYGSGGDPPGTGRRPSIAARSARASLPRISALLHRTGSPTAAQSAGLTAEQLTSSIPRDRYRK
ncbi:MAG: hypothetical protein P8105_13870 [Dehalococcoidia bacterium]